MKLNASWNHETWCRFSEGLTRSPHENFQAPRTLVVAAHPDDESIGASLPLTLFSDCSVVFLTDGAPRDTSLRSSNHEISREAYSQLRSAECHDALHCAGLSVQRIVRFDCVDQEAIYNITGLVHHLVSRINELRPETLITHPYEGGHPDHDTAALITSVALDILQSDPTSSKTIPLLVEMTSYHAVNQQLRTGEFLTESSPLLELELTAEQRDRKRNMLSAYASQKSVLQSFTTDREVFRPAPVYEFHEPPHQGKLWYECLGWEMTGERWRSLASEALAHFDKHACR